MKNELAFQTKIVNTIDDMGGHAFKSNNRFKAGIPDLHYTLRGGGVASSGFIECKFIRQTKLDKVVTGPTPKQRQFAEKETKAGGLCTGLCWVQHPRERRKWLIVKFDPAGPTKQTITCEDNGLDLKWNEGPCKMSEQLVRFI